MFLMPFEKLIPTNLGFNDQVGLTLGEALFFWKLYIGELKKNIFETLWVYNRIILVKLKCDRQRISKVV